MRRIYIAGKFTAAPRLRKEAGKLMDLGHRILSTWLLEREAVTPNDATYNLLESVPNMCKLMAERGLVEVRECEVFIIDTLDVSLTGGREVELGLVLGRRHPAPDIYLIGPVRNLFHLAINRRFNSWAEFHDQVAL